MRLSVLIEGPEGRPWITFAHSLATRLELWDEQARAVVDRYRVLRFDMRGHGRSDAPPGPYAFADLVGDVVGLWDALGIERSHFVGLSIGGMTGLGLALDRPDRLLSLVACDCRADAPAFFRNMWEERQTAVQADGLEGIVDSTIATWFPETRRESERKLIARVRGMVLATSPVGYLGCTEALKQLDYKRRLGDIRSPTLMIVGDADGAHPQEMQAMTELVSDACLIRIGPAGHLSNLEQPDAFNEALLGFLEGIERGRS